MKFSPKEGVGNAGFPWHPRPRVRLALVKSPPRVRDDRDTPPLWDETVGINKAVSTKPGSEIFLVRPLDTKMASQPVGQISWRTRSDFTSGEALISALFEQQIVQP
jgi:hypothetical protein